MTAAIIIGPDEKSCSEESKRQLAGIKDHVRRQGYELVGYVSRMAMAIRALEEGFVQVLLFAGVDRVRPVREAEEPAAPAEEPAQLKRHIPAPPGLVPVAVCAPELLMRAALEERALAGEKTIQWVTPYRAGYSDGFVDCLSMIRARK
jgi:hypothetical protein